MKQHNTAAIPIAVALLRITTSQDRASGGGEGRPRQGPTVEHDRTESLTSDTTHAEQRADDDWLWLSLGANSDSPLRRFAPRRVEEPIPPES
jgi:hypothetical protein